MYGVFTVGNRCYQFIQLPLSSFTLNLKVHANSFTSWKQKVVPDYPCVLPKNIINLHQKGIIDNKKNKKFISHHKPADILKSIKFINSACSV